MPYIISQHWHGVDGPRHAVATLADPDDANAIDYIGDVLKEHGPDAAPFWSDGVQEQLEALTEAGGTVGPLADGTVIEVARAAWFKLAIAVDMLPRWQQGADTPRAGKVKTEIIDAYNAAQA